MSSASACVFCHSPFSGEGAHHICPKCGAPQPVSPRENYFDLLGVARGFRQDLVALERKFYDISRALHPDRFAAGPDQKWKTISVERMSAVNKAYQTLTKADRLREYILELEGVVKADGTGEKKTQIPAELAEEWFELQDAVMEEPTEAEAKLSRFESDLRKRSTDLRSKIRTLETEYDQKASGDAESRKDVLKKIEKLSLDGQYLKSMERDLLKLKSRLGL